MFVRLEALDSNDLVCDSIGGKQTQIFNALQVSVTFIGINFINGGGSSGGGIMHVSI